MPTDVCIDLCIDVSGHVKDMCADMYVDVRIDICIDVCIDMHADMYIDMSALAARLIGSCQALRALQPTHVLRHTDAQLNACTARNARKARTYTRTHARKDARLVGCKHIAME